MLLSYIYRTTSFIHKRKINEKEDLATEPNEKKYIEFVYADSAQEFLRAYCVQHGFDLTVKYDNSEQEPADFDFHSTIFYSTTEHDIRN
jgi:hypothetical protein